MNLARLIAPLAFASFPALFCHTALAGLNDLKGTQPGDLPFGGKFQDADGCILCHGNGFNGNQNYLPFDTWAGSMMANAARDPVFFAALAVANQDMPGIGSFCIRCHTPLAFVRGHAAPDASQLDAVDLQGVGCETCHRAESSPLPDGPFFLGNAQLVFDANSAKRGPYANASSPAHATLESKTLGDSRFCGQCHQVTNPERKLRDAMGNETAYEFPLDTTYEEWALSDFAQSGSPAFQSCADCHMKRIEGAWPIATPLNAPLRDSPRTHALAGGNVWGIEAVKAANPERAQAFSKAFENAYYASHAMLRSAVEVSFAGLPDRLMPGESAQVQIRVENKTGHKFPTGYAESRRAWLAVSFADHEGNEVVLIGGYDAQSGHIQAEPKPRIYKAQHGRWNGASQEAEEHLALHDSVLMDSRIPPRGFSGSDTTLPLGEIDYTSKGGGYKHYDEVSYTVQPPPEMKGHIRFVARVYFQSMTREYIEFLRDQNTTTSHGQALHAIYEATGSAPPIEIASAEKWLTVEELDGGVGGQGGGGGNTMGSGGASVPENPEGGCDCRIQAGQRSGTWAGFLLGLALLGRRRRRRLLIG